MTISNKSGSSIDLYFISPETGNAHKMTEERPFPTGYSVTMNTHTHHVHELRQLGACEWSNVQACKRIRFENPDHDKPHIIVTRQFQILFENNDIGRPVEEVEASHHTNKSSLVRLLQDCQQSIKPKDCLERKIQLHILETDEQLGFERSLRQSVGGKLENYTCLDDSQGTSPPLRVQEWQQRQDDDDTSRTVWVLLDRPAAKIHLVHDFVSQHECQAMEEAADGKLSRASVADGKGGTALGDARKALQAGIRVPWHLEKDGNPIAKLSRRVYDYVNHVLDMNIDEFGQENLMSIQYKGRGYQDKAPDQYQPHCDGDCDGLPHKHGTRMATMVMYCTLPEKGGHTNFRYSNVHVKPEKGMAVFFSYMDPKTNLTDTLLTEHSGCPVWEGDKKIVTQWVRYGVSKKHPWTSFNTLGVKKSEAADW